MNSLTETPSETKKIVVGEPFNPSRKACGFYPPDVVARVRTWRCGEHERAITDGHKRLYERAVRWAGQRGSFWYSFAEMGQQLGKSERQVRSDMRTLEQFQLIRHKRRGRMQSNVYEFLWHQIFERDFHPPSERQSTATHLGTDRQSTAYHPQSERQDLSSERQPTAAHPPSERQWTAVELCNKNELCKESSSNSVRSSTGGPAANAAADDDDENPSLEKPKPLPDESSLEERAEEFFGDSPLDVEQELGDLQAHLRATRAEDLETDVSSVRPPDRVAVEKITAPFLATPKYSEAAFYAWCEDTVRRSLATKARDDGWAIYWTDAERQAEFIVGRVKSEWYEAFRKMREEQERPKLPQKVGEATLPARCQACNAGMVGSIVDRTFAYCSCPWGQELQFKDPQFPEREIERVHACPKALMVQACGMDDLCLPFTGDAIEEADISVSDFDLTITVTVTRYRMDFDTISHDIGRIKQRLGWSHAVNVVWSDPARRKDMHYEIGDGNPFLQQAYGL